MASKSTPTYTIELLLHIPVWQQHRLEKRFKIARHVYNSCLGEALKRHKRVKADQEYRALLSEPTSDVDLCNAQWNNFVKLYNREIARLKQSPSKTLRWFVA